MSSISLLEPPKWCREAILTHRGWESPETGEVYIRIKGIKDSDIEAFRMSREPMITTEEIVVQKKPKVSRKKV